MRLRDRAALFLLIGWALIKPVSVLALHEGSTSWHPENTESSLVVFTKHIVVLNDPVNIDRCDGIYQVFSCLFIDSVSGGGYPFVPHVSEKASIRRAAVWDLISLYRSFGILTKCRFPVEMYPHCGSPSGVYEMNIDTRSYSLQIWDLPGRGIRHSSPTKGHICSLLLFEGRKIGLLGSFVIRGDVQQGGIGGACSRLSSSCCGYGSSCLLTRIVGIRSSDENQQNRAHRFEIPRPMRWIIGISSYLMAAVFAVVAFAIFVSFDRRPRAIGWGLLRCVAIPLCIFISWHLIWYALSLLGAPGSSL